MPAEQTRRTSLLAAVVLLALAACWGSTFFMIKDLLDRVPTLDFLAVRFAIASLALLVVAPKALGRLSPVVRRHAVRLVREIGQRPDELWAALSRVPVESDAQACDALAGNLCRCTGYRPIVASLRTASVELFHFLARQRMDARVMVAEVLVGIVHPPFGFALDRRVAGWCGGGHASLQGSRTRLAAGLAIRSMGAGRD